MSNRLENRLALITGASRGIGRAVAKRLASEGAHVILTARTVGALEELDDEIKAAGGTATLAPLDLSDGDQIDLLGQSLHQRFGKLDILVANAGQLGPMTPVHHISPKEWDDCMTINLTANYRLIRSLDPLLKLSDHPRAMFVSSGAVKSLRPFWGAYAAGKAALEALVTIYAKENINIDFCANCIHPGVVATGMRAQAFPGEDPTTIAQPEDITDLFVDLAAVSCERNGEVISV